jgi:hypothetical protein
MYCPSCGTPNEPDANFCTKCGRKVSNHSNYQQSQPTHASQPPGGKGVSLAPGVKDWLLFLCIGLTILGPIINVFSVGYNFSQFSRSFQSFPDLRLAVLVDSALTLIVSAFGAYAGYLLWSIKPNAVVITKLFLVVYAAFSVAGPFLFFALSDLPAEAVKILENDYAKAASRGIVFSAGWLMYLYMSKRVRITYRTNKKFDFQEPYFR